MKLLLDQNLSFKLVATFAKTFPGSAHVRDVGLASAPDPDVWAYAAANGFTIISKDSDFKERSLVVGFPPKVVWLRLGNCSTDDIAAVITAHVSDLLAFQADPNAAFLALS